jgi:hypothetical protein
MSWQTKKQCLTTSTSNRRFGLIYRLSRGALEWNIAWCFSSLNILAQLAYLHLNWIREVDVVN